MGCGLNDTRNTNYRGSTSLLRYDSYIDEEEEEMRDFVTFTGEETEKEFLVKCLEQWSMSAEKEPLFAMMEIRTVFSEIRHRVEELEDK